MMISACLFCAQDVENMQGSTMDAMSSAVENSEVMLYGVCNECEQLSPLRSLSAQCQRDAHEALRLLPRRAVCQSNQFLTRRCGCCR